MKCRKCGRGIPEGVTLYRMNKPGEMPPVWECEGCLTPETEANIDPVVLDISRIIGQDNREE